LLHESGSTSPLHFNKIKISLYHFFIPKDGLSIFIFSFFIFFFFIFPIYFGDPENFILANSTSSPYHIKPE